MTYFTDIGNVYIADRGNNRICKVTVSTGVISTIAGTISASYSGDNGAATSAALNSPHGVALDSSGRIILYYIICVITFCVLPYLTFISVVGNVYIADTTNNRIRRVMISTGIISTIAGSSTSGSYNGEGHATSATLNYPYGVALDSSGMDLALFDFIPFSPLIKLLYSSLYFTINYFFPF